MLFAPVADELFVVPPDFKTATTNLPDREASFGNGEICVENLNILWYAPLG
jgi:hypothetical protein